MPFYAICPYFLYEKKTVIGCEHRVISFSTYGDKKTWMLNKCCTFDYKYCAYSQILTEKYNKYYENNPD